MQRLEGLHRDVIERLRALADPTRLNGMTRCGIATEHAYPKRTRATRQEEFVKRAGFVLMAGLTVVDKCAPDEHFAAFLPLVARAADDERNFVQKAVNWALRQIGKRNPHLNAVAIETALALQRSQDPSARWIAAGALRELRSRRVQDRLDVLR
ncbi:MAG: DNA alkylation repair protein [Pseudonocardiales bacterium]